MSTNSTPVGNSVDGAIPPAIPFNPSQIARLRDRYTPFLATNSQDNQQGIPDRDDDMNGRAAQAPSGEDLHGIWDHTNEPAPTPPDSTSPDPTVTAAIQNAFRDPSFLSLIQQASAPSSNQIVALSAAIVHQLSEQLSQKISQQVEERLRPRPQETSSSPASVPGHNENQQGAEVPDTSPMNIFSEGPHRTRDITPADHQFNTQIRIYLKEKGLWYSPLGAIPQPPPAEDVEIYQQQQHPDCRCPTVAEPQFDWNRVLANGKRCLWNSDLLSLLAREFKDRIQVTIAHLREEEEVEEVLHNRSRYPENRKGAKSTPFDLLDLDSAKLTIPALRVALDQRLVRTKTVYLQHQSPHPGSRETPDEKKRRVAEKLSAAKKRDRMFSRRRGLYRHRKVVIQNHRSANSLFWDGVDVLVTELGEHGMSEDETDNEGCGARIKEVRRVRAGWRNPNIVKILDYVDGTGNGQFTGAGNRNYVRHRETKSDSVDPLEYTKGVPLKLPANYYDNSWRSTLTEGQRIAMQFGIPRPLPDTDEMEL